MPYEAHHSEDARAEELAKERADSSPDLIRGFLHDSAVMLDGQWLDLKVAQLRVLHGDECSIDQLLVVLLHGDAAKLRASHLIVEALRESVYYRAQVESYLPDATQAIRTRDQDDADDFSVQAYVDARDD